MGFLCIECVRVSSCETLQWYKTCTYWWSCWFISFNLFVSKRSIQSMLNPVSEMGWGAILLENSCNFMFIFSVFHYGQTNNTDVKINIFLSGVFATKKGPTVAIQKSTPHVLRQSVTYLDTSHGCSAAQISHL